MLYKIHADVGFSFVNIEDRKFLETLIKNNKLDKFCALAVTIFRQNGDFISKPNSPNEDIVKVLGVHNESIKDILEGIQSIRDSLNSSMISKIDTIQKDFESSIGLKPVEESEEELDLEFEEDGENSDSNVPIFSKEEILRKQAKFSGN